MTIRHPTSSPSISEARPVWPTTCTGRSARHVTAVAEHLGESLRASGHKHFPIEGLPAADWVLIDAGDVIVHLFRPEVRSFYNLEKMWSPALIDELETAS